MKSLKTFLAKHERKGKMLPTHTNMNKENGLKNGSYCISDDDYGEFLDVYVKALKSDAKVGLVEIPMDVSCLTIDVDIEQDSVERQYEHNDILEMVAISRERLSSMFDIDSNIKMQAWIFEKDTPTSSSKIFKDGWHIVFPSVFLKKSNLKKFLVSMNDDRVDKQVSKFLMYGSVKEGRTPYQLTCILNHDNTLTDHATVSMKNILNTVSLRKPNQDETPMLPQDDGGGEEKKESMSSSQSVFSKQEVQHILTLLNSDKCDDYHTWISIGMALKRQSKSYLDLWIDWSKQSDKYQNGLCERKWKTFSAEKGYTIATLCYFAKTDSPVEYKTFCRSRMTNRMKESSSSDNHYDVAVLMLEKYNFEYVCTNIGKEEWYEFTNHRWQDIQKGYSLKLKIHTEIYEDFLEASRYYAGMAMNANDMEQKHWAEKAEECLKIANKKLKNESFASQVMKIAAQLFFKRPEDFLEKLDENKFLFGVANGVLDLVETDPSPGQKHRVILRPGYPDDFLTKSCRLMFRPYEQYVDAKDPRVEELRVFRESIFTDPVLRDYFEGIFSSALDGYHRWEKLFILIGDGSNGKSKYMNVLEHAFGEYCSKVSCTLFTGKEGNSSSASPDMMAIKGARLIATQEPNKGDRFNMSKIKSMTGDDKLSGRRLYGDQEEFTIQAVLTIACNTAPSVSNQLDYGSTRRMEYIPFETTFRYDPKKDDERNIDPYLGKKLREWPEVTMSYLVSRYCRMREEGLKVPEKVLRENQQYERLNNSIQQWKEEFVIAEEDGVVKVKDAYSRFRMWMKESDAASSIPNQKDFVDYLTKQFDKAPEKKMWRGYTIKYDDDDDQGMESSFY